MVESYAALKSLSACADNSKAACNYKNTQLRIRCNGSVLDAGREKPHFSGEGATASLDLSDCTLKNGHQKSSHGGGGAILVIDTGNLILTDCKFEDSEAERSGGAIRVQGLTPFSIFVARRCTFAGNLARTGLTSASRFEGGGGLYFYAPGSQMYLITCSFQANRAGSNVRACLTSPALPDASFPSPLCSC